MDEEEWPPEAVPDLEEEQRKRDYERLQGLEASQAELAVKFRRQGRKCLRKRLTTSFIWLNHQLPSLLTQTMSATSGS